VNKLLALIGSFIGGYVGWWIATPLGFWGQFVVSMIGTAAGTYYGRKVVDRLLES
jgi:hypothetical protein